MFVVVGSLFLKLITVSAKTHTPTHTHYCVWWHSTNGSKAVLSKQRAVRFAGSEQGLWIWDLTLINLCVASPLNIRTTAASPPLNHQSYSWQDVSVSRSKHKSLIKKGITLWSAFTFTPRPWTAFGDIRSACVAIVSLLCATLWPLCSLRIFFSQPGSGLRREWD